MELNPLHPSTLDSPMNRIVYRQANIMEILSLRYSILCAHRPWDEAQFKGDGDPQTHHFGAFLVKPDGASEAIGCVSYMMTTLEGKEGAEPTWQFRGMATRDDWARKGIGRALVFEAEEVLVNASPIRLFWCRARVPAIGFYEKLGWRVIGEQYVVEGYGPHKNMKMTIDDR